MHLSTDSNKIALGFQTTCTRVPYACAREDGSLLYANGNLVPDFCVKCVALVRFSKCNRKPSASAAARGVIAYIAGEQARVRQLKHKSECDAQAVQRLLPIKRRLASVYRQCTQHGCHNLAELGYKTCEKCRTSENAQRLYALPVPVRHRCATRGCCNKTSGKYCRSCAAKHREQLKSKC